MALSNNTPCMAQFSKLPFFIFGVFGGLTAKSLSISLKIFTRDGGGVTPSGTEKESP